jgi:non-specific riboncleoside hydrolase
MPQKVLIDCDPGIDDAIALALALFDPRLEVVGVTACAGNVDAERSTRNVQALIEKLDPPRHPRIGAAMDPEGAPVLDGREVHGDDGLANAQWEAVGRQHVMPSDKLISHRIRENPGELTVITLGPLTGIAKAFQRDPGLIPLVNRLIMVGGSVTGNGDCTPCSEFNMHFDPSSAEIAFQSATTKTLIPLEVTSKLTFGLELIDSLPPKHTRVGKVLHALLPHFFRTHRQLLGRETISLQAVVGVLMATERSLFETSEMAGRVETTGELTRGMTIFDQRSQRQWRKNIEVATNLDIEAARDSFYNSLRFAGQESLDPE